MSWRLLESLFRWIWWPGAPIWCDLELKFPFVEVLGEIGYSAKGAIWYISIIEMRPPDPILEFDWAYIIIYCTLRSVTLRISNGRRPYFLWGTPKIWVFLEKGDQTASHKGKLKHPNKGPLAPYIFHRVGGEKEEEKHSFFLNWINYVLLDTRYLS